MASLFGWASFAIINVMRAIETTANERENDERTSEATAWDDLNEVPFAGEGGEIKKEGRFDSENLPLSENPKLRAAQEKFLRGEPLSLMEKLFDRDGPSIVTTLDGHDLRTDAAYRVVKQSVYEQYLKDGMITRNEEEYVAGKNNGGVDWYLGGAAAGTRKYGGREGKIVVLECPAEKEYFTLTTDNGNGMVVNPRIRHIKSSSQEHPVPMEMITRVFFVDHSNGETETKQGKEIA